jgi:hypothetical protein
MIMTNSIQLNFSICVIKRRHIGLSFSFLFLFAEVVIKTLNFNLGIRTF